MRENVTAERAALRARLDRLVEFGVSGGAGNDCAASLQACALRVARLGADGVPIPGATAAYVTDTLVKLILKPVVIAGDEIQTKNACGALCVDYKELDVLGRLDLELEICSPDPELHEILLGGTLITSGGQTIGYQYPALKTPANVNGVSMEIWTKAIIGDDLAANRPYFHWALPRTRWMLSDKNMENAAMTNVLNGFATENPNWFNGPFGDWVGDSSKVAQWERVGSGNLPNIACGYQNVVAS